jgi:hypothetical protein
MLSDPQHFGLGLFGASFLPALLFCSIIALRRRSFDHLTIIEF